MAIAAGAIFEVRSSASDGNGGFFVPGTSGTIDYSQQNAPQLSVTDGVANGTTTITSITGGFTAALVNNGVNIAGALYQITAYTNTNTITVDRTVATASALTINVGGALATVGFIGANCSNLQFGTSGCSKAYLQYASAPYLMSATANVSGGSISLGAGQGSVVFIGYYQTRGDITETANLSFRPTIKANAASFTMFSNSNNVSGARSIIWDGGSYTAVNGFYGGGQGNSNWLIYNCKYQNFAGIAIQGGLGDVDYCEFTGCSTTPMQANGKRCWSHNNSADGFGQPNGGQALIYCISSSNTGNGFGGGNRVNFYDKCSAYKNGGVGLYVNTDYQVSLSNSISYGNTGYDISGTNGDQCESISVAYGTSNANFTNGVSANIIQLTANPFVNPDGTIADISQVWAAFSLNNAAGGGALCRGAGTPQYLDIGATQHQDSGGGGVPRIVVPRRMW